ncbi:dolichyl-phosphate-mannose-glycolipid alpha-mannosyltransferase involved in GPI anchor biosynthesis [Cryptosporidium ryanae]|uniref:dolichyl-phosphate-mannose-glycolipid alpha-mannosyltransferase involved in GPI anchor biosynthesis n=1 Tax=Cryptosporidium ryanae TaxID=515981 RepID=UPI00351A8101|nr:dolichyl-phosphate-mannose-glycolipid alpha-mannosyltransferase involved in GPI anchor biosynthesis [Cryptosporidium ryanae]
MFLYILILAFRIFNAIIIQTTYNPDEYWQSLEVAYKMVNGFGYLTWEWEPCISLRNALHPLVFAVCYRFIINPIKHLFGNNVSFLYLIPRVYQSVFATLTDIGTSKLAYFILNNYNTIESKKCVETLSTSSSVICEEENSYLTELEHKFDYLKMDTFTLLLSMSSWYYFFTICRTYSQCIECCFNVWSAYYIYKSIYCYSENKKYFNSEYLYFKNISLGVLLSAMSVLIRSSSLQFWVYFYLMFIIEQLISTRNKSTCIYKITTFVILCILIAIISVIVMIVTDYWFYNKLTVPIINFVKFNLIGDPGKYYGKQSILYFFTETPLVTLFSYIPLFISGIYASLKARFVKKNKLFSIFQITTFFILITFSLSSHKEHRFIIPYFPFIMITNSIGLHYLLYLKQNKYSVTKIFNTSTFKYLLIIQAIPALFFTTFHQRGGENVIRYFSRKKDLNENEDSIFFISQCHMYPIYSYLNKKIPIGFLDCSPPINDSYKYNWNQLLWKHKNTSEFLQKLFIENHNDVSCVSPYISTLSTKNSNKNNNVDFKNCLNYKFDKKLCPKLPTYFVIHSYFNENIKNWLKINNYKFERKIFDSFISETPNGYVFWSYYFIYSIY